MPLTGAEIARRSGKDLEIRTQPQRVRWKIPDLAASDGHRVTCTFGCSVAAVDRPADRQMLAETFLVSRDVVDGRDVATHFGPALIAAASQFASATPGEALLNDQSRASMEQALRSAAKPVAFAAGLELLAPFEVHLSSPSVERLRMESMERQLAERRSAGQLEHFQHAAELLKAFDAMRATSPGLSVSRVLEAVSENDRGAMLQTLLAASTTEDAKTQELWAVGGMGLMKVTLRGGETALETWNRPTEVGPPRSLREDMADGEPAWFMGCRSGVQIIRASDLTVRATFRDEGVPSTLGFSRVVAQNGELTACHSEAGIVRWRFDRPESPTATLRPMPGEQPRFLCSLDDTRLVYSRGRSLVILIRGERTALPAESDYDIVALLPLERELFVVHADGEVMRKNRLTLDTISRARHCGLVTAAAFMPWVGGVRLLLATLDGPVCCVGVDDSIVTQYVSPHRGLKGIAATNGLVAGISADRQRLVMWNAWDGRAPVAELNVTAKTRHRVADIAFASTPAVVSPSVAPSSSSADEPQG